MYAVELILALMVAVAVVAMAARALRVPSGRIVDILNGKRAISAETALRLGRFRQ